MDKNEIATVLEDAARLYKDEKVAWCSGSWVEGSNYRDVPEEEVVVSACAEGAILRASGFTWEQVEWYEGEDDRMLAKDPEAYARFIAARNILGVHLLHHMDEYLVTSAEVEKVLVGIRVENKVSIPGWNDRLQIALINKAYDDAHSQGLMDFDFEVNEANEQAKSLVIDAMEATAKDLRNG